MCAEFPMNEQVRERIRIYGARNVTLRLLGYKSYKQYLGSNKWTEIRLRVLARDNAVCCSCHKPRASQVHHLSYSMAALNGDDDSQLRSICPKCHKAAEISTARSGRAKKRTLREANGLLDKWHQKRLRMRKFVAMRARKAEKLSKGLEKLASMPKCPRVSG